MLGRIIWGLVLAAIGGAMCYYSYQIVQMFWRNDWAEKTLWGTRNLVVFIGVGAMVIWVLVMFGVFSLSNPADQVPGGFGEEGATS